MMENYDHFTNLKVDMGKNLKIRNKESPDNITADCEVALKEFIKVTQH